MAGQQIDIVANLLMKVDGAEAGLKKLQNSLSQLKMPNNLEANFRKSFSNLEGLLTKYKAQLKDGFKTKGDITAFAKTGRQIEAEYDKISAAISKISGKEVSLKIDLTSIHNAEKEIEKLLAQKEQLSKNIKSGLGLNDYLKAMQASDVGRRGTKVFDASNILQTSLGHGDIAKAKADVEGLINELNRMSAARKQALEARTGTSLDNIISTLRNTIVNADNSLNKFNGDIKTTSDNMAQIRADQMERVNKALNNAAASAGKAQSGIKSLNGEAQQVAQNMFSMSNQLDQLKTSTQYFFGLRNMFNLLKRGFSEALNTVKELDAAMTETAVVTKFDIGDMWEKLPEYTANANALGATVKDMYKSATLYYQQGLNEQQAMSIAAETMKMARIGGLEAAEATDMMTAALRGFNMELNETSAKRINDVYSNLAAKTASNTEELGNAMQRTASIAANAGMSFEGTASFLAQAIETTREPAENIGTAMKTIIARMQEMKKNPLEIGEVEGEEVDYNKIDAALKTIGISLKKANGDFRDNDEVLLDISKHWDSLAQNQQRYIATTIAGSRQQSRFIAMVGNYERTQELLGYANDSAGASDEQFGKTMESMEAKLNRLKNAWELFTMGLASNDMLKGAVDGITKFIDGITNLIDKLSLGSDKLKSILTIFTAFTGLKMAGRAINGLLGGLGGMLDPNSSILKGTLGGGAMGSRQATSAAQAKMINQPIVNVLNQILGAVRTGKTNTNVQGSATRSEYLTANQNYRNISNQNGATVKDTLSSLKKLDAQQVRFVTKSNVGITSQLQSSLSKSLNETNVGEILGRQLTTAMSRGNITGAQLANLSKANIGKVLGTQEAEAYSQNFANTVLPKMQKGIRDANIDAQMKWASGMKDANQMNQFLDTDVNTLLAKKVQNENGEWVENTLYDPKFAEYAKQNRKAIEEQNKAMASMGNMLPKTDFQKFQQGLGQIGGKAISAGQGLMSLGNTLNSMGFEAAGAAVSSFGNTLSNLGMVANSIPSALSLITKLMNPVGIAAAAAGATVLLATNHLKKIKQEGEQVTKDFSEKNKNAEDNIAKLKSYQGELSALSQGVDSNGNNINLDDSQYQRYLEIVDTIAEINPEIVDGYNAQGHAIINNNKALEETLKKQQQIQKEAYDTYTNSKSLQKLINARNINADYEKGTKKFTGTKMEDSGKLGQAHFAGKVSSIAESLGFSTQFDESILKKYGIDSLKALKNGEEQAVKNFVKHREQIENELSNSGIKLSESVFKGFDELGQDVDAFDEAIKPIYDNLLTSVSKSKLFESLAPEIQEAFKDGLKDIAAKDLNATQMQQAVNYLGIEFQNAFDNAKPLLDQADEALNTFAKDLDEAAYNDTASNLAEQFRTLATEAEAAGQIEIAEWYENQASRITNAITDTTESIAENIDTLSDNIATAKSNFEALGKGIDDYYTLADQAHGLVETALEEKNTEGEGSKTFWNTYRGLASEESFEKHDIKEAVANMKQFQKYFTEGSEGSKAFAQKMIEWQDKSFQFTDKYGKTTTRQLKDFFRLTKDGTMEVTEAFTELNDEQYAQLASVFTLGSDGFTAILNKLRQFGDLNFTDAKGVRKAMAFDERTVKTEQKVKVKGEDDVNRLYYGQSMLDAETADLKPEEKETLVNDLKVQGSIQLPSGADALIKAGTDEKKDGSLLKQFVQDTKGTGKQVENVMKGLYQSGEYDKSELEKIHSVLTTDESYGLTNAQDANVGFEQIYSGLEKLDGPAAETNSHLSDISSTVNTIAGIIAAGKVGEGYLPDAAKQSGNLYNELVGKKGVADTWAQLFSKGKDQNGNVITDDATYRELDKKLTEYATANDNYIRELKQGREAAINNGASPETIDAFDKEIDAATHNAELIKQYLQDAADNYDNITKASQSAADITVGRFQEISNQGLTTEQNKTEITGALQGLATNLQNLDFKPEQIQSIFKDNFGIELELKGGEFATDVGKQIEEQISNLGEAEINAILNISSINMAAAARGKNNTPSAIRRVGTMARGSKRGYTINGEPTLTGELGPELVWEPKQNAAYMVGEHGPQFANISKNAVVWNAEQTKRIKKNSKGITSLGTGAYGIHSLGTMAGGNIGGTKIPGTLEVDANANILEVIPPTIEPEIPVKAELEVEGNNGGILGKLFGGKSGPSINVEANVTSINTGEEQKTIQVIGNITKLNSETTTNSIDATATVTRVIKSSNISGEPISVKAVATTTKVKNETPEPQETTKSQIIKVSADTSVAQAKINQLIQTFNKVYTLRYTASGPSSISVPISANFTGSWQKTVTINKGSGAKGINNHIGHYSTPTFNSAAKGYGQLGPKGKGGLTLTGEKGFEIAWLPSESRSMILGVNGPQMLNLPSDAVVYTHEQSKKILKQKSVPAGSHAGDTTATGSNILKALGLNVTQKSGGSGGSKPKGGGNNNSGTNNSDLDVIIEKAGKVSVWWENMARRIEATQRKVDKNQKKFETLLKTFGKTAQTATSVANDYRKSLKKSITLNQAEVKKANRELKSLDKKGKTSISYDIKKNGKKTTKKTSVNLGDYIKEYDGTYVIDQKALNKVANKNKSKAEAIKSAAEQKINDKLGKKNKAEDEIAKAQEALDKIADDIYTTFYQWENSLNKVYFLSKRLSDLSNQMNVRESQSSLLSAKALAGFGSDISALSKVLTQEKDLIIEQVTANQQNLEASKKAYDDSLKLSTYVKRYQKAPDSKEAQADFKAAQWALKFLESGGKFDESKIAELESKGYSADTIERIKKVIEDIDQKRSDAMNAAAESNNAVAAIYSKITEYQDYISDFESELLSGLEEQTEKEINKLDKINSSLTKAYKELLDEVKRALDERRRKEDNAKTESDISKKQQRLALLQADTSGGHATEIAQLEKEISEAQQNYQRSLEDQLIEKLQNQGDKAEKQRQKQIDLLNIQKDIAKKTGSNLADVQKWLNDWQQTGDKQAYENIRNAWLANHNYDEATDNEKIALERQFDEAWMKYGAYSLKIPELQKEAEKLDENTAAIQNLTEAIIGNANPSYGWKAFKDAGGSAKQARELGATAEKLKKAGYLEKSIFNAGYSKSELSKAGFNAASLTKAGITAKQLRSRGYGFKEVQKAGKYSGAEMAKAGYTAAEFKKAGYSAKQTAKYFKDAGFSAQQISDKIAQGYGKNALTTTNMVTGKSVQTQTGASAASIQKTINKSKNDKATQSDLAGVTAKMDINGKKKGGKKTGTISESGKQIAVNKGSTLYVQKWDTKTGKPTGKAKSYTIDKLTTNLLKKHPKEAKDALIYAIQHKKPGELINKKMKDLVSQASLKGKTYKLQNGITGSIGKNGKIYYNTKKEVKIWDAAAKKLDTDKYKKANYLKKALKNDDISREYAQVLIAKKAYTKDQLKKKGVKKFATGGLADYTGPAWLDGTPSKPELVLNAQDTKNFVALKDVLSKAIGSTGAVENTYGNATYEININVDHLNNDYDVDKVVERVKKKIVQDSSYRNVTQVRKFR